MSDHVRGIVRGQTLKHKLNPDAPCLIQRWSGYIWEPHGYVVNLAEAQRLLRPRDGERPIAPLPSLNRSCPLVILASVR
ncbi:DUF6087 family protein [Streptomyces griseofuscus]|uniref:DUF6087 family protein n=1 Tax=Streptomyces griseofuscus TaxID=146922 RepID=UPI001FAE2B1B|nr:DUF6087 family protein [Streptomyces griseofuscus]